MPTFTLTGTINKPSGAPYRGLSVTVVGYPTKSAKVVSGSTIRSSSVRVTTDATGSFTAVLNTFTGLKYRVYSDSDVSAFAPVIFAAGASNAVLDLDTLVAIPPSDLSPNPPQSPQSPYVTRAEFEAGGGGETQDTGWRYIDHGEFDPRPPVLVRRRGTTVEFVVSSDGYPVPADTYEFTEIIPIGFRPEIPPSAGQIGLALLVDNNGSPAIFGAYVDNNGSIGSSYGAFDSNPGVNKPYLTWETSDPWPTVLPGVADPQ